MKVSGIVVIVLVLLVGIIILTGLGGHHGGHLPFVGGHHGPGSHP